MNTTQIAEEAVEQLQPQGEFQRGQWLAIIKAAIEDVLEPIGAALGCDHDTLEEILTRIKDIRESRAAHASEPERSTGNSTDTELSRYQKACQEQAEIIAGLHRKQAARRERGCD